MKSRMIISLMVIALAAALIGGATMAWFTDADTSEPVTFTAGTLLIDIDNFNRVNAGTVNLGNLNPGDVFEYQFDVVNSGTKNLIFTGLLCYEDTLGNVNHSNLPATYGTNPLSEVLEVELSVVGNDTVFNAAWAPGVFYKGTLAGYDNNVHPIGGLPTDFEAFRSVDPPIVFGEASLTPGLDSSQNSLTYHVKFTLPKVEADNKYQGSSLEAAFVVMAKQIHPDAEYGTFACPLDVASVTVQ